MRSIPAVACVVILGFTAQGQAGLMTFTDRASFEAAAGSLAGFESFEIGFPGARQIVFPGTVTIAKPLVAGDSGVLSQSNANATNGASSLQFGLLATERSVVFGYFFGTVRGPINAFGFDIATSNQAGSNITLSNYHSGELFGSFSVPAANEPVFFGVIDTMSTFRSVKLETTTPGGTFQIDSVSFGTASVSAVPEPSSLALFGLGGLSLFGYRLRRKRKTELTA